MSKYHSKIFIIITVGFIALSNCSSKHSYIHAEGKILVDPQGNHFRPKGTNLGNWLVPEGYMFKTNQVNSPYKINEMLNQLVGPEAVRQFWDTYLDRYITEADIKYLASLGFNHLRVPLNISIALWNGAGVPDSMSC